MITLISALLATLVLTAPNAQAEITEYFTEIGGSTAGKACKGEGNKIVGGQLFYAGNGGTCKPAGKYCAWGMGNKSNCLFPCRDAAVGKENAGKKFVSVPPFVCPSGPLKGKTITKLRVSDVGKAITGGDIDVFKGICAESGKNKKGQSNGVCKRWASDEQIARYGSGSNTQYASIAKDPLGQFGTASNTAVAAARSPASTVSSTSGIRMPREVIRTVESSYSYGDSYADAEAAR